MSATTAIPVVELADLSEAEQIHVLLGKSGDVVEIRTTSGQLLVGTVTAVLVDDERIRWLNLNVLDRGPTRVRWTTVESVR